MENSKAAQSHILHIDNRNRVDITGVTKVITFNEDNVILNTVMGVLNIKGRNMQMNKLNVENGEMSIEGEITAFAYTSKENDKKESMLKKLFK